MRVLFWGELFWPYIGGAELFAANLMLWLRERGYEVAIVASHDSLDLPDEDRFRGIPVHRFPFRTALQPEGIDQMAIVRRRAAELVGDLAPDVIHLNGITPNAFFCLSAAETGNVPLLARLNQEIPESLARPDATTLSHHVLRVAAWVVGVSQFILEQGRRLVPEIAARSSLIYNGVETPATPPTAPPPREPPHILCLGRVVTHKGFDVALEAMPAILRHWPSARLTIAGEGPEREPLAARAAALGIASQVEIPGPIAPEDVPHLISGATLVAMPSRREGLPAVALQAAARGRPVVATRCGGLPEVVLDGRTGVLVDLDSTALAEAIGGLLARPEVAERMGAEAWRRVRTDFDERRCFDAYDALYRRLAGVAG